MKRIIPNEPERVSAWVGARMGETGPARFSSCTAVGLEENGTLIVGVVYDYFNGTNINAHIAAEGHRWLTRAYLHFIFWYPFVQLECNRLTALVPATNLPSRAFVEHLGFTLETLLAEAHPTGDVLVYRMFRRDCRWTNLRVKYEQATDTSHA